MCCLGEVEFSKLFQNHWFESKTMSRITYPIISLTRSLNKLQTQITFVPKPTKNVL